MSAHILRAAVLAVVSFPVISGAATLAFDEALERAVQRSEAARSARAGVTSASELARTAGRQPDPTLRVGIDNLPLSGADRFSTRDSMTMKRIGLGQEWLSSEKRAALQSAAQAMVEREATAVQAQTAEIRLQTGLAYLDAYFAGEALALALRTERHRDEELEAARARLSSAAGSSQDVLALMAARGTAADDSAEIAQQQAAAFAALERWTGAQGDGLTPPANLRVPQERVYVAAHPAVISAQQDAELARKDAEVARTNRRPNWSWEMSYGQRAGYPDMVSVGVNIPLAIAPAQRQDREIASKLALLTKAEAALVEATRMATGEYRALAGDASRIAERIGGYRSAVLLPAQQRSAATLAAYRSNQAPLMAIFEARDAEVGAQRKLLSLERELARVQAQLALKPVMEGATP